MEQRLDPDSLADAWERYKCEGDQGARNALILHYTILVRSVASRVAARLPKSVDRDDLISYGLFGLLDAMEKYDLGKQVRFETYAVTRIRGNIIDEIRDLDWVPRTVRARMHDVESAENELHAALGRAPSDTQVASHLGIPLADLWEVRAEAAAGSVGSLSEHEANEWGDQWAPVVKDLGSNPEDLFSTTEVSELLADAVSTLSQRFKTILVLYYLQEMTLAEIGQVLGVTETRVCQLQTKLLQTLREALSQGLVAAA